jgi:hypothetical protein
MARKRVKYISTYYTWDEVRRRYLHLVRWNTGYATLHTLNEMRRMVIVH